MKRWGRGGGCEREGYPWHVNNNNNNNNNNNGHERDQSVSIVMCVYIDRQQRTPPHPTLSGNNIGRRRCLINSIFLCGSIPRPGHHPTATHAHHGTSRRHTSIRPPPWRGAGPAKQAIHHVAGACRHLYNLHDHRGKPSRKRGIHRAPPGGAPGGPCCGTGVQSLSRATDNHFVHVSSRGRCVGTGCR